MKLFIHLSLLFSAVVALAKISTATAAANATPLPPPSLVRLESIGYQEVCGVDVNGKTACLTGASEATWIPDGVGILKTAYSNDSLSCGFDEVGLKCWKLPGATPRLDGVDQPQAFRNFLGGVHADSIRLATYSACGINATSSALECLVPDWNYPASRTFKIAPTSKFIGLAVDDSMICWAEGTPASALISCQINSRSTLFPNVMKLSGLVDLRVGPNWVCARSKTEGSCWNSRSKTIVALPTELVTARQWAAASDALCALTQDLRVACADPIKGTMIPAGLGHSIPPDYASPNPKVAELWTSASVGCVRMADGAVNCWNWWNVTPFIVKFTRPVTSLFGGSSQPCGLLDNGQAECRMAYYGSQTLSSADRIRVEFGGYNKCYWNSSGVDCRGSSEAPAFRSVTSLSASRDQDAFCIVGVPADEPAGFDSVHCSAYDPILREPPFELRNPTAATTNGSLACALSDDGLTCWGYPYAEVPMPTNISLGTKIQMAPRHACVLDQFGFICWGELVALGLEVPRGLEQPGRVVDFALGSSRTCVVIDDGTLQCWGRDFDLSGEPPATTTASSIVGRAGLFCALDSTGTHCWGGQTKLPK